MGTNVYKIQIDGNSGLKVIVLLPLSGFSLSSCFFPSSVLPTKAINVTEYQRRACFRNSLVGACVHACDSLPLRRPRLSTILEKSTTIKNNYILFGETM